MDNARARVLMVEDTPDDIELAHRLFERCGASGDVVTRHNAEEALDYLFGKGAPQTQEGAWPHVQLILLDMGLPRLSGLQFLEVLRRDPRTKKTPVAVLTVSGITEDAIQKSGLTISGYLRKPIEMNEFLNCYQAHVSPAVGGR